MLGGDVAQRPDDHFAARVGILGVGERRRHPQPMAVPVGHRNRGQRSVRLVHQIGERVGNLAVGGRITFCRGPPRVGRRIRQPGAVVAEHVDEGGVDLGDRARLVADEQRLLQRVDERRTPAGVVVTHTCQHDVGTYPGQQLGGGERLDQIVIRAGAQPGDRGLRPGTGREQQHRHRRGPPVRPQRRNQPQAVQDRHHHIADHQVRRGRSHHLQCRAAVGDRFDDVTVGAQQPAQIVAHVGVVVGDHHAHRPSLHVMSRRRVGPDVVGSGVRGRLGCPAQRLLEISVPALRGTRRGPGCDGVGWQVRGTQRKPDREGGALPLDAVDVDRPAVQSDQFLDQGQADPAALVGARPRVLDPVKPFEQTRNFVGGDSDTGVGDDDRGLITFSAYPHRDCAVERELQCVRQQVEQHLLPHVRVDIDRLVQRCAVHDQRQTRPLDGGPEDAGKLGSEHTEIDWLVTDLGAAGFDSGEIQQRVDQFAQS